MTLLPGISSFAYKGSGVDAGSYAGFNDQRAAPHAENNDEQDIVETGQALSHTHRAVHFWTDKEFLVLMLAVRFYLNTWPEITKVLNRYFPTATSPFLPNNVASYFATIRTRLSRKSKSGKIFTYVFEELSFNSPNRQAREILEKLEQTGREARIILRQRPTEDMNRQRPGYVAKLFSNSSRHIQHTPPSRTRHQNRGQINRSSQKRAISIASVATDFLSIKDEDDDVISVEHTNQQTTNTVVKETIQRVQSGDWDITNGKAGAMHKGSL
jgi:hypothetical protein